MIKDNYHMESIAEFEKYLIPLKTEVLKQIRAKDIFRWRLKDNVTVIKNTGWLQLNQQRPLQVPSVADQQTIQIEVEYNFKGKHQYVVFTPII